MAGEDSRTYGPSTPLNSASRKQCLSQKQAALPRDTKKPGGRMQPLNSGINAFRRNLARSPGRELLSSLGFSDPDYFLKLLDEAAACYYESNDFPADRS